MNNKYTEARLMLLEAAKRHKLYQNVIKTGGNIVISKGPTNPDLVFVGEAPGFTENKVGYPFVGKSGFILGGWSKLLKSKWCVINAVPIIPLDNNDKIRAPTDEEVSYFRPFVNDLLEALNPKYVICVGKTAAKYLKQEFKLATWNKSNKTWIGFIYHPAYYLRNGRNGNEDFQKLVEGLQNEIRETDKRDD